MKIKAFIYIASAAIIMLTACTKDNYTPPASQLTGKVVYQGQAIGVRSNGVQLELWQHGYQLFTKIPIYIDQDGSFSATLFDGDYKLVRLKGNGPWVDNTDSIDIKVSGSTAIEVPVTPFFTISPPTFTFNKSDTTVTGTFTVNQVVAGRTVDAASISVGSTQFADVINNVVTLDAGVAVGSPVSLTIKLNPARYPAANQETIRRNLTAILDKQYSYLRIGVKTNGVAERIYATVQKVNMSVK